MFREASHNGQPSGLDDQIIKQIAAKALKPYHSNFTYLDLLTDGLIIPISTLLLLQHFYQLAIDCYVIE
jgi:hypothetical protein